MHVSKALNALFLLLAASCTTGVDGGEMVIFDAAIDAPLPAPDALAPGAREGIACQVSPSDAQGGCAQGYACIELNGPPQCRQLCPTLNFACEGYSGPGYSLCASTYSDGDGQVQGNLCLVVCGDENQTLRGCDDGSCNGSCPGAWTCEIDPSAFGLKSCR